MITTSDNVIAAGKLVSFIAFGRRGVPCDRCRRADQFISWLTGKLTP